MKDRQYDDEVIMMEQDWDTDNVGYDDSEDMFAESELTDYDMNTVQESLGWADY